MNATQENRAIQEVAETVFGGYHRLTFSAMGTQNEVLFSASSSSMAEAFKRDLLAWVEGFEQRISRFRPDSLVSRINQAAGGQWVEIDPETRELFTLCNWFHWMTRGVFDPSAAPLMQLWDYHAPRASLPSSVEVATCRAKTGWSKVQQTPGRIRLPDAGMAIDLGGIGKEYAVDKAVALARRHGIPDLMVNFGRDIRAYGHPPEGGPWRIGLERPDDPETCWGGVNAADTAICGSGTYARGFDFAGRRYGHILDPQTGWPADNGVIAAWVVAPSCTVAGILSTAAVILGSEEGLALIEQTWGVAGCLWTDRGIYYSRRFHEYRIDGQ